MIRNIIKCLLLNNHVLLPLKINHYIITVYRRLYDEGISPIDFSQLLPAFLFQLVSAFVFACNSLTKPHVPSTTHFSPFEWGNNNKIVTEMFFAYVYSVYHSYALVPVPSLNSCPSPLPCPLFRPSVRPSVQLSVCPLSVVRWSVADIEPRLSSRPLGSEISFGRGRNQIETIFLMCAMCIINNLLDFMVHRWVAGCWG